MGMNLKSLTMSFRLKHSFLIEKIFEKYLEMTLRLIIRWQEVLPKVVNTTSAIPFKWDRIRKQYEKLSVFLLYYCERIWFLLLPNINIPLIKNAFDRSKANKKEIATHLMLMTQIHQWLYAAQFVLCRLQANISKYKLKCLILQTEISHELGNAGVPSYPRSPSKAHSPSL